jgi:hypothetical protein
MLRLCRRFPFFSALLTLLVRSLRSRRFLALRELDREYVWFRPMMEAIAMELMKNVAMGVKLRAGLGAGLSLMDMVSDTIIVRDLYLTPGKGPFAKALLACLAFNITWQVVIVIVQAYGLKKNRLRTMLLESLAVVTFVKPVSSAPPLDPPRLPP